LQQLADEATRLIPCRGACALLLDRRQESIERLVTAGRFPQPQAGGLAILLPPEVRREIRERGGGVVSAPQPVPAPLPSPPAQDFAQRNLLILGILLQDQSGFLLLADKQRDEDFHDRDVQLLTALVRHATVALGHARQFAETHDTQAEQHDLLQALITAQEQE